MKKNPLGMSVQDVIAGALYNVIVHVLPHHHNVKREATQSLLEEMAEPWHGTSQNIFAYCLDNDLVHDLLKPLFKVLGGRQT